jgi:hypothetical protein
MEIKACERKPTPSVLEVRRTIAEFVRTGDGAWEVAVRQSLRRTPQAVVLNR